jgi:hypothetical protein
MDEAQNDSDFVKAVVCGWKRKDFDAEYSPETLSEMLLAYPALGGQIARAYLAELSGAPQLKNSLPPPATGL